MKTPFVTLLFIFYIYSTEAGRLIRHALQRKTSHTVVSDFKQIIHSMNPRDPGSEANFNYIYGAINTTAEYFTSIQLGTPGQIFTVQVDTGSSALAVPAKGCKKYNSPTDKTNTNCNHAGNLFSKESSSTLQPIPFNQSNCTTNFEGQCGFGLSYGDGSFLFGPEVFDNFTLGGLSGRMRFGLVEAESPSFARQSQIDGIMGMAYGGLDPKNGDVAFERLVKSGEIDDVFSMCLHYQGGAMILGGYDTQYNAGPIQWTPIIEESYYVVRAQEVGVHGKPLPIDVSHYGRTIVDSGTTLLAVQTNIFVAIVNEISRTVCSNPEIAPYCALQQGAPAYTQCVSIDPAKLALFPEISITLNGTTPLVIPPSQYFFQYQSKFYCFGVQPFNANGIAMILGDTFMIGFNTIFDRANRRVGFAPVGNCQAEPAHLQKIDGEQNSMVHVQAKQPLVVRAIDANGNPIAGTLVQFSFAQGSGSFSMPQSLTDTNGTASTRFTLSHIGTNKIRATLLATNQAVQFEMSGQILSSLGIGLVVGIGLVALCAVVVLGYVLWRSFTKKKQTTTEMDQGYDLLQHTHSDSDL